jgi:hypothetical protein
MMRRGFSCGCAAGSPPATSATPAATDISSAANHVVLIVHPLGLPEPLVIFSWCSRGPTPARLRALRARSRCALAAFASLGGRQGILGRWGFPIAAVDIP